MSTLTESPGSAGGDSVELGPGCSAGCGSPAVTFEKVSFSYGSIPVLNEVSLRICAGDFACVVGPNGGGKTTFLKLVAGLMAPISGQVRVLGFDPAATTGLVGYVPQTVAFDPRFPVRVLDVVLMGVLDSNHRGFSYTSKEHRDAACWIKRVGLPGLANRPFSNLSGGQRQKALLARALMTGAKILVLDEPTSNLDAPSEEGIHDLLAELNNEITIIMVSHDLGFVSRFVKSVICMGRKILHHPTSEITGEIINRIYGSDMCMIRHDHRCSVGEHSCQPS